MADVMSAVRRAISVLTVTLGTITVASAMPMSGGSIDMDYTATGQIMVNVYGDLAQGLKQGSVVNGLFSSASSSWDPLALIGGRGTVNGFAVFGNDTADAGDDFVRFWLSYDWVPRHQVWQMPTGSFAGSGPLQPVIVNPEPASMILFGTGLVGLAAAVRRRRKLERREK